MMIVLRRMNGKTIHEIDWGSSTANHVKWLPMGLWFVYAKEVTDV